MNVISHRIVFGSFVHNIADSKVTAHTAQHYSKCVVWLLLNLHDNRLWIAYKAHSIHCTLYSVHRSRDMRTIRATTVTFYVIIFISVCAHPNMQSVIACCSQKIYLIFFFFSFSLVL